MKYKFLINVAKNKISKYELLIHKIFSDVSYSIFISPSIEKSNEECKNTLKDGTTHLIIIGGDGTFNSVAKHFVNSDINIGIIPAGTGNGLAHHIGFFNPEKSLKKVKQNNIGKMDVGVINNEIYFFSCCGVGFDAYVSKIVRTLSLKLRGMWMYFYAGFKGTLSFQHFPIKICYDEQTLYFNKTLLFTISNSKYYGGKAKINPVADISDGLLDCCLITCSKLRGILSLLKLYNGRIYSIKGTSFNQCSKFSFQTEKVIQLQIDGEYIKDINGNIEIGLLKNALNIIY